VIPAKGYKTIKGTQREYPGFSTGLSNRNPGVQIDVIDSEGKLVDHYEKLEDLRGHRLERRVHARIPDGGVWYYLNVEEQTPDAPNPQTPPDDSELMPSMEKGLRIEAITVSTTSPAENAEVLIVAKVSDVLELTSVVIKWKKDGADQTDIAMIKEDVEYKATIPGQTGGTVVAWTLLATNADGKTVQDDGTITWSMPPPTGQDYTMLRINEVNGVSDNNAEIYYELYNLGEQTIYLAGVEITYVANGSANMPFPPTANPATTWLGTAADEIEPNGFFLIKGRTNATPPGPIQTGLSASLIMIAPPLDPDGNVIDQYRRAADTPPYEFGSDASAARIPDGIGPFYFLVGSRASNNIPGTPGVTNGTDITGLTLVPQGEDVEPEPAEPSNELFILQANSQGNANGLAAGFPLTVIELYNNSDTPINLAHYTLFAGVNNNSALNNGWTVSVEFNSVEFNTIIPAKSSYLIVGGGINGTPRAALLKPDFEASTISLNAAPISGVFKLALMRGRAPLTEADPRDHEDRYIDMLVVGNAAGITNGVAERSTPQGPRRTSLVERKYEQVDYRGQLAPATLATIGMPDNELYKFWPRNSAAGPWDPISGSPAIHPLPYPHLP
jgi:hypothetical protein